MSVLLCLAESACIVERSSNVAYSSNVLELLGTHDGCMVCSVLNVVVQAVYYYVIKHVTSRPVNIHLLSAAVSPVTSIAPPSALTTAFACPRARSIIIGENCRFYLCTITFQFRTLSHLRLFLLNHIVFVEDRSILCIIYIVFGK